MPNDIAVSCTKIAEPIEIPFGSWTRVGFLVSIYGVHIGAIWRIRLNHQCAAAMRPYVKRNFARCKIQFAFKSCVLGRIAILRT